MDHVIAREISGGADVLVPNPTASVQVQSDFVGVERSGRRVPGHPQTVITSRSVAEKAREKGV
jgi:hypothetical protein